MGLCRLMNTLASPSFLLAMLSPRPGYQISSNCRNNCFMWRFLPQLLRLTIGLCRLMRTLATFSFPLAMLSLHLGRLSHDAPSRCLSQATRAAGPEQCKHDAPRQPKRGDTGGTGRVGAKTFIRTRFFVPPRRPASASSYMAPLFLLLRIFLLLSFNPFIFLYFLTQEIVHSIFLSCKYQTF